MRAYNPASGSGLFMIELVIMIAFFSMTGALCIRLFADAYLLGERNSAIAAAVNEAQNAAECFKATGGNAEEMATLLGCAVEQDRLTVYYDANWNTVEGAGDYTMSVRLDRGHPVATARISVTESKNGETLFRLTAKKYIP